jgi:hypothetical protein
MITALVPEWFLLHETPVGRRWVYRAPDILVASSVSDVSSPDGNVELHTEVRAGRPEGRLVADHKLNLVTYRDRPTQVFTSAAIKDEKYISDAFPASITSDEWNARCTCDGRDSCTWCETKYSLYDRQHESRDGAEHAIDLSSCVELPGGLDEYPHYAWKVGIYENCLFSDEFHHLRPGTLLNVRTMLVADLEALPNVTKAYDQREFSVYVAMQWEEPKTAHRPRTDARGRKLKGTEQYTIKTIETRYEIPVPYSLTGQTKAEAVRAYIELRDKWVVFFYGADAKACRHCDGYGYITTKATS